MEEYKMLSILCLNYLTNGIYQALIYSKIDRAKPKCHCEFVTFRKVIEHGQ